MPGPSALEAAILLEELIELGRRDFALHPMAAVSGLAYLSSELAYAGLHFQRSLENT